MVNLDKKIFGEITLKEVIGAEPSLEQFQKTLEDQFQLLQKDLNSKDKKQLQTLLDYQIEAQKEANSRPGSMALAQNKIRLLINYSQRYIVDIKDKLS